MYKIFIFREKQFVLNDKVTKSWCFKMKRNVITFSQLAVTMTLHNYQLNERDNFDDDA